MHEHIAPEATITRLLDHRATLLRYLRNRVASPELAEDLLQDCLLKALRSAPGLRDEEKLLPWFYRILNNALIDLYRSRGSAPSREDIDLETLSEPPADEEQALCACFRQMIPSLKPEYAVLIERLELSAGDPGVIANELGITRNALKVRRHRARQALRQQLGTTCRVCAAHGCLDCTCRNDQKKTPPGV